jgi:hypothetical protein
MDIKVGIIIIAATFATIMLVGGLGMLFVGDSMNNGTMISQGWTLIAGSVGLYIFDGIIYFLTHG